MLDSDYPEHSVSVAETGNCDKLIADTKETVYTNVAAALGRQDFFKYKPCMMSDLKKRRYAEYTMKQAVFLSSESMSQEEIGLKVNAIIRRNKSLVQDSMKLCMYSDLFGKLFDDLFDQTENEEEDDALLEYCVRKYVVDSNLVDTKVYKVTLNPKNLDVQNVNCKESLETQKRELMELIEEMLDSESKDEITSDCARQRFLNTGFVDKMMEISVLSEMNITDAQKEGERKRFVDFIGNLIKSVVNC